MTDSPSEEIEPAAPVLPSTAPPSRDDVFGDLLPEQTGDDRDGGDWRDEVERDRDDELRDDVPPHH